MRHQEMPEHGLKCLGVRRDRVGVDRRHDHAGVRDFGGIPAVTCYDAQYFGADSLRVLKCEREVGTDVLFEIPTADGKHEERVGCREPAHLEPLDESPSNHHQPD